jgi:high-affinity iron transporter
MILIDGIAVLIAAALGTPFQQQIAAPDSVSVIRRLAATAQLASQEYRLGVDAGRVVSQAEVDEATLFLQESRRSATQIPAGIRRWALVEVDQLIRLVDDLTEADSVEARVERLTDSLAAHFGITLDPIPSETPSQARGASVYRANCAGCHGDLGQGNGPLASGLEPKPTVLSDARSLFDQSPLDFYRKISIGVVGTAMPAFESRLSAEDRWAAALYATVLRLPRPSGPVPSELQSFAATGHMSDVELLAALGQTDTSSVALARVAAVRAFEPDAFAGSAQVFTRVRAQIESTLALAQQKHPSAGTRALDSYMTFEQIERPLRAKNSALAARLETDFAALRTSAAGGASGAELGRIRRQLESGLENAERALGDQLSAANLFFQSFVILVREGLEAILLVGALLTFLVKVGAGQRRRDVNLGVGAAVLASLLTAVAIETVFHLTPANQEALEGITMVAATIVLFYVSYWLLSKMEVAKWNHFVKTKVRHALSSGSSLALASAAFLAVYREGFETVLFYKALFLAGGSSSATVPILAGILLGTAVLIVVYLAINRFGMRLPLKPFFGVTSAFLYYMAFVFAGKGVAELQEGGYLTMTIVSGAPRVPALGIYPTLESLAVQGLLLLLLAVALVWTFVIEPRRQPAVSPAAGIPPRSLSPPENSEMRAGTERTTRHPRKVPSGARKG